MLMLVKQIEKMFSDGTIIMPYDTPGGYSGVIITECKMGYCPSVICIYLDDKTIDGDIVFDRGLDYISKEIYPEFVKHNISITDVHNHSFEGEDSYHLHINIPYSIDKLKFLSQYF